MNVLIISCTRKIAGKLAGKILDVLAVYRVGKWQVLCPFPYSVFAVYQIRTLGFAPSVRSNGIDATVRRRNRIEVGDPPGPIAHTGHIRGT